MTGFSALPSSTLKDDLQHNAVTLFFRDYVIAMCGTFNGWLSFLPDLYTRSHDNSILRLAIRTAAYANFWQKRQRHDVSIIAISSYNRVLGVVSNEITKNGSEISEDILITVFLLGLYEVSNTQIT
jgi:hypothetical protein